MGNTLLNLANRFMVSQFPVWGGDGSQHMDRKETAAFPDLHVIPDLGGSFLSWKGTQGAGYHGFVDRTFPEVWRILREYNEKSGKFVARFPFHFWDYSPKHYTGSPELFGAQQAKFHWNTIKSDPGEIKAYLDAEPFAGWFYLNWMNQSKPMQVAKGFIKGFSDCAGYAPGLYTSPGMLPFFGDFFKDLDLWLAWYNETRKYADLQAVLKKYSWRGELRFWQYASDGDIDEDGVGDGLKLGMEEKNFDLDIWVGGGMEEFSKYCGKTSIPVASETSSEDSAEMTSREERTYTIINPTGLNVRAAPSAGNTQILSWLPKGGLVHSIAEISNGVDVWLKRAEGGYCAKIYNGVTYLK